MDFFDLLLMPHILCGALSLLCAGGALYSIKGEGWHRRYGRFFFYGMTGVFVTAIPMSLLRSNLFLFLISLFSYYLAFTGWRFAKNSSGTPTRVDWLVTIGMIFIAIAMICAGGYFYSVNPTYAITLWVFGAIGVSLSGANLKIYQRGGVQGNERLIQHFTAMIAATIAAVTAFVVTNVHLQPAIILWIGPTVLLVPVILYWKRKIHAA